MTTRRRTATTAALIWLVLLAVVPSATGRDSGGSEWALVTVTNAGHVAAVDLERGRVSGTIRIPGPRNVSVSRNRRYALVTSPRAGKVSLVDALELRISHVFGGLGGPRDVEFAPDGRFAYVVEARYGTVAVLDLRARRLAGRVWIGRGVHDLAVRPDGARVWVTRERWTQRSPSVLASSDPRDTRVLGPAGGRHIRDAAFAPDGLRVWVTYWGSGLVGEIRAYSRLGSLRSQQLVASLVHRAEVDDLGRVWVTDPVQGRALSVERTRATRRSELSGCPGAHDVAVGPGRGRIVVACADADHVLVFDPTTRRSTRIQVGAGPHGVAVAFRP